MAQNDFVNDLFTAFKQTGEYKDRCMLEIMMRRQTFENNLDEIWRRCVPGNVLQIAEYRKQVQDIKACGLVVMRSKKTGKHKIVMPK